MDEQQLGNLGVSIHAGFPNAAVGSHAKSLDLTKLLIQHPTTTFMMRLDSNTWAHYGMFTGDIIIVDRSINPGPQDVIIWCEGDDFVMTKLKDAPKGTQTWGTVSSVIHQLKK